jgi:hypothetical protein
VRLEKWRLGIEMNDYVVKIATRSSTERVNALRRRFSADFPINGEKITVFLIPFLH